MLAVILLFWLVKFLILMAFDMIIKGLVYMENAFAQMSMVESVVRMGVDQQELDDWTRRMRLCLNERSNRDSRFVFVISNAYAMYL